MKKYILFLLSFACSVAVYAQNRQYKDVLPAEAAQTLYPKLIQARQTQNPSLRELIALKYATNLPAGLTDTLYKYDWGKLRSFHYEDSPEDVIYTWEFANFEIQRFAAKKATEAFDITDNNGKIALTFLCYSHSTNHGIAKIGQYHYIVSEEDGKKQYARIVQYKDGILIYDVSAYGTLDGFEGTNRIFRSVMVALPRVF
jgi:hypothetical protein